MDDIKSNAPNPISECIINAIKYTVIDRKQCPEEQSEDTGCGCS